MHSWIALSLSGSFGGIAEVPLPPPFPAGCQNIQLAAPRFGLLFDSSFLTEDNLICSERSQVTDCCRLLALERT